MAWAQWQIGETGMSVVLEVRVVGGWVEPVEGASQRRLATDPRVLLLDDAAAGSDDGVVVGWGVESVDGRVRYRQVRAVIFAGVAYPVDEALRSRAVSHPLVRMPAVLPGAASACPAPRAAAP